MAVDGGRNDRAVVVTTYRMDMPGEHRLAPVGVAAEVSKDPV